MIAGAHAVLWVRQDGRGNDACRFANAEGGYLVDGSSTDADWNILRYRIRARGDGTTRRVRIGAKSRIHITRAPDDTWLLNGKPVAAVTGASDIHLGFTPATWTLPLRRLDLDIGGEEEILMAHLDVEDVALTPLRLVLRRLATDRYECTEIASGTSLRLSVDAQGIVRTHEGRWIAQI